MAEGHPGGLREEAYALSIEQQEEVKTPLHSILSPIPHTMGLDPPPHGTYKPLKPPSGALQKILFMGTGGPPPPLLNKLEIKLHKMLNKMKLNKLKPRIKVVRGSPCSPEDLAPQNLGSRQWQPWWL